MDEFEREWLGGPQSLVRPSHIFFYGNTFFNFMFIVIILSEFDLSDGPTSVSASFVGPLRGFVVGCQGNSQHLWDPDRCTYDQHNSCTSDWLLCLIVTSSLSFSCLQQVPGVKKEDVEVKMQNRVLTIRTERKGMEEQETDTFRYG